MEPTTSHEAPSTAAPTNRLRLQAVLSEAQALRYTPAGLPALEMVLQHSSSQHQQADSKQRIVALTLHAAAFGLTASQLSRTALGSLLNLQGFLVNGSGRTAKRVVFQVEQFEVMSKPAA